MATAMRNRGRVSQTVMAFHGGNLARADFHVTPPFGSSILLRVEPNEHNDEAKKKGGKTQRKK
jgi:hypothetical protein